MTITDSHRLTELPNYDWCSVSPTRIPDLVEVGLGLAEPAIPELTVLASEQLPTVDVRLAHLDRDNLVPVSRPVKTVSAYQRTGWPYAVSRTYLRRSVADRLAAAYSMLPVGFGLAVWDGWRDPLLQAELHRVAYQDPTLLPGFVNPPSADPSTPPPHATGGTVDLTLTWGAQPLSLGTTFDAFVPAAFSTAFEDAANDDGIVVRNLRRLLRRVMVDAGFVQLDCEWWHFEYGTRLWAAIHDTTPLFGATSP